MNVPLTPLDFLERARRLFGPLEAVVDGERRYTYGEFAARCPPARARPAERPRLPAGRPRRVPVREHGRDARGVLRRGARGLRAHTAQRPPGAARARVRARRLRAPRCSSCIPRSQVPPTRSGPRRASMSAPTTRTRSPRHPPRASTRGRSTRTTVCELFYTSGSTGDPKGAMLTHRALATHAVDSALTMGGNHRDVVLHTIPLFHVNGWGTPHWVTALGGRHVMLERFDAGEVLRLIAAERVTRLHLVPTMATALLDSTAALRPARHLVAGPGHGGRGRRGPRAARRARGRARVRGHQRLRPHRGVAAADQGQHHPGARRAAARGPARPAGDDRSSRTSASTSACSTTAIARCRATA